MAERKGLDRVSTRQLWWALSLASVFFCAITVLTYQLGARDIRNALQREMDIYQAESRSQLIELLSLPAQHLTGMAREPMVQTALEARDESIKRHNFSLAMYSLVYRNPRYFQVRWILPDGREQIKIIADTLGIRELSPDVLQNKSTRPYHQKVLELNPYETYVSQPDLNVENGLLERPLRPVVRYAIRLPSIHGVDHGYLIFNLLFNIHDGLLPLSRDYVNLSLADHQGNWLMQADSAKTWGHLLGNNHSVKTDEPELWAAMQAGDSDISSKSGMWAWSQVAPSLDNSPNVAGLSFQPVYLLTSIPRAVISQRMQAAAIRSAAVLLPFLGLLIIGIWYYYKLLRSASQLRYAQWQQSQDLLRRNEFILTLTESLPNMVSYWTSDRRCVYANKSFREYLQLAPGTDQDISLHRLINYNEQSYFDQCVAGEELGFQKKEVRNSGESHLQIYLIPNWENSEGGGRKVAGVIAIATDLTQILQAKAQVEILNEQLKLRTKQAEAAAEAKSSFLANMSHEIRTPMNGITGLIEILKQTPLDDKQRDYVGKLSQASTSLLAILNDILDVSKLEAGKVSIVTEPYHPESLVSDVVNLFEVNLAKKGVALHTWIDPLLPSTLQGDQHRLRQVLNNLLSNANKFTEQGQILLSVTREFSAEGTEQVRYSVKDSGVGIKPEKLETIFGKFNQADESTERQYGGTGLGLSICEKLVTLMGGNIGVLSTVGKGSEFYFNVPMQVDSHERPSFGGLVGKRALLVDDSDTSNEIMQSYLTAWGMQSDCVSSVEEAVTSYQRSLGGEGYDLVIVDWKLGEEDGVELLKSLQALTPNHELASQIMMVTAYNKEKLMDQLKREKKQETPILTKPVLPSTLYNAIADKPMRLRSSRPSVGTLPAVSESVRQLIREKKILLVEDNLLNQEVALTLLGYAGLHADVASSGVEALNKIQACRYDVILLDLHMPEMDGFETCRRLRKVPGYGNTLVVALTAAVLNEDVEQALAAGMDDHLGKPFDVEQLLRLLGRWFETEPESEITPSAAETAQPVPDALAPLFKAMGVNPQEMLRRFRGNESMILQLLRNFSQRHQDWPAMLRQTTETEALAALVHTIKGTTGTMGLMEVYRHAEQIEEDFREGRSVNLEPLAHDLEVLIGAVLADAQAQ
ncbi:response regulator [Gilvimarinus sp. DA14]|uniref:response regulator n=1 Tax=Gilvimarinus sp. DA14 TaxID=2956798 RepID=UPI0020B8C432|nr:response regulator [Gilvimarinus sp. DA14]UTF59916.1 response regulator [Gilvimarinus sp. DA14]